MTFKSKLPAVGTTIFSQMSQLATEQQAINLSQGFPDFPASPKLVSALAQYSAQGLNQYAPMPGIAPLREQIAALIQRCYRRSVCAQQEVTVTSGATEALFVAISAIVSPGDEVIIFDPAYDSYAPAIALNGGKAVHIALTAPDYRVNWLQVADAVTARTKLIIVNSPHNPSGMVFSQQDWLALQQLVLAHNLFCISDEVYEHMVFDGAAQLSANGFSELAARSFIVSSFGKTFHVTGWKLGYCVAPPALTVEFRKIHQYVTFASFTPAQYAIADMLAQQRQQVSGLAAFYQQKRDSFAMLLANSRFNLLPCQGTYFQLADYSAISELDDVSFCRWLATEHKVAAIPLSVFYQTPPQSRIIRFCFAKQHDTLQAAAEALCQI
ncbi:aminotransferase class I/II-fold pyridoxal phosphate-dependent enzyme [Rheinheimera sp. MA13]|uniref:Aminotransferase class I/II-fold pyridoxal phosphate-dependent enzyme n=1 Tax=Rheinheimera maricola TaxID=2793282 RepID=A0ABS7XDL2_9GAMM|nr:methionine aminotransferase [Rheinheimera maricola]MBZ9613653.1 aminotransferase class I/II-fold pyridoxal phosphate-dependent enzyme [Rheinheimera maricola]